MLLDGLDYASGATMPAAHAIYPQLRTQARDTFVRLLTRSLTIIGIEIIANMKSVMQLTLLLYSPMAVNVLFEKHFVEGSALRSRFQEGLA